MENKYWTVKKNKESVTFLKRNGYKKLKSAIYNPKSESILLINRERKEYWETCSEGLTDASEIVLEFENQKIQPLKSMEALAIHFLTN